MREMNDIEQLMRKHLKEAEQQAPGDAWESISQRLDAGIGAPAKHTHRTALVVAVTTAVLLVAGVIYYAVSIPTKVTDNQQASTVQNFDIQQQPAVSDSKIVEETPVATAAEPASEEHQSAPKANVVKPSTPVENATTIATSSSKRLPPDYVFPSELFDFDTTEWVTEEDEKPVNTKPAVAEKKTEAPTAAAPAKKTEKKQLPYVTIPDAVTPNGDGINDFWVVPDLEKYGTVQVRIYTSRRQKVYSSNDYKNDFCGTGLPDGTYFYEMAFRDYNTVRRGVLEIKR